MPKIEDLYLTFDQQWSTYAPGETVTGICALRLNDAMSCDAILVHFLGSARVFWTEYGATNSYNSTAFHQEEIFYDKKFNIWEFSSLGGTVALRNTADCSHSDSSDRGSTESIDIPRPGHVLSPRQVDPTRGPHLPKGFHKLPFSFTLPTDIPTSFEASGVPAYIRHSVKASVRLGHITKATKKEYFSVVSPVDLNSIGASDEAITRSASINFPPTFLAAKTGEITATASVDKGGYVPGEPINVSLSVVNQSNATIRHVKVHLAQLTTCFATSPQFRTKESKVLVSSVGRSVKLSATSKVDSGASAKADASKYAPREMSIPKQTLRVPAVVPTFTVQDVIEGRFAVVAEFYGKNTRYLSIDVPIYIGTIPVMKPTKEQLALRRNTGASQLHNGIPTAPPVYTETNEQHPSSTLYPDLRTPPPSYEQSVMGRANMDETPREENPYRPRYTFYNYGSLNDDSGFEN